MRKSVFLAGLCLWLIAGGFGAAVYFWPAQAPQVSPGVEGDSRPTIVDPTGKQPIRIAVPDRSDDLVPPPDWEPPLVEGWTLIDHTGEEVTRETMLGQPYVATFIFTRCRTHCPDLVQRVADLESRLKEIDVRFLTVSVDPEYDTAERLAMYAEAFSPSTDRWRFLTGSKEQILEFARYGFRQLRSERPDADSFIGPDAAHSLRLMHVDKSGRLTGTYHFRSDEDLLALRRVLEGKAETKPQNRPLPPAEQMQPVAYEPEPATAAEVETSANPLAGMPSWALRLPSINAGLNSLATLLLVAALIAIKRNRPRAHRSMMLAALAVSGAFLGCYLVYHWALGQYTDSHGKPFPGSGIARTIYFAILVPHVLLAVTVPFLAGLAVWRAWKQQWKAHRRVVRWAYPIWLFVSVTGVIIYAMLYHWPVDSGASSRLARLETPAVSSHSLPFDET